jgi:hypothetical protein
MTELNSLPKHILIQFQQILNQLSPENLSCDGELPQSEINIKYKRLTTQWANLEKKYNVIIDANYYI